MKIDHRIVFHPRVLFVLLLLLVLLPATAAYALDVKGVVDTDSRWTIGDSPVRITGDVVVAEGVTVTIDPGVKVIFRPRPDPARGYNLTVEGTLVAQGDETGPVTFTAEDRDLPWGAIVFQDSSQDWDDGQSTGCLLSHCIFEYGGNNPDGDAMIVTLNAMPRIVDNVICFSSAAGIASFADDDAVSVSGDIRILENRIHNNATGLILSAEGGRISDNYFLNNGRAIDILTRSNDLDIQGNTILGTSGELFGSGLRMELGEAASGITAYRWEQTSGPAVQLVNANSVRAEFIAPDPGGSLYTLTFNLTVTDGRDNTATESVEITVIGDIEPPVAVAGGDRNVQLSDDPLVDTEVTLSGTGSYDSFSGIVGYRWQQIAGRSVTLQNANTATPAFVVPSATQPGELMRFRLTVINRGGLQASDDVDVRYYSDNIYPFAVAGEDITAYQGQTVTLDGSGSTDPDGGIAAYLWTQTEGTSVTLFNANTGRPFFEAPDVTGDGETLTFVLGVQDTGGLVATDEISVFVKGSTIADAGGDQTVSAGDTVVLDGNGSVDLETQAAVDIADNLIQSENAAAGLTAITAVEAARYRLQITGNNLLFSDEAGYAVYLYDWPEGAEAVDMAGNWWGSADVEAIDALVYDQQDDLQLPKVNSQPFVEQPIEGAGSSLGYPPVADAGPDLETSVDMNVTLDGSGSYDPEEIGAYQWQQVEGPTVTIKDAQNRVASFVAPPGSTDGQVLRFSLTMRTADGFSHTDEVSVTVTADDAQPIVETGGGCFIQSVSGQSETGNRVGKMTILMLAGIFAGLALLIPRRNVLMVVFVVASFILVSSEAGAGFIAVGGGDGGDAEQYNATVEIGAKDIDADLFDMLFAVGIPFIPHGEDNLPDNTIASSCPNNDCQPLDNVRKGTEVGFYTKVGIEIGSTNLYVNAIGGFTVYTESELVTSPGSGAVYENSSDTTIEPMFGGGLSYFPDYLDWPILIQVDYDTNRGVTGTIGWYW